MGFSLILACMMCVRVWLVQGIPLNPEKENILLDMKDFRYLTRPDQSDCGEELFLQILVQSRPSRFRQRQTIRETWGSVKEVAGKRIQVNFLMGKPLPPEPKAKKVVLSDGTQNQLLIQRRDRSINSKGPLIGSLQDRINDESSKFGDIIQGNFEDSYRNVSYKHLMAHKWITAAYSTTSCRPPVLVLKADDDVFVEIFHLIEFASAAYGERPRSRSLMCDVVSSGTAPRSNTNTQHRRIAATTSVTMGTEKKDLLPDYCSGMAYLMTPDLAQEFVQASREVPRFPLDDVYVLGFIRRHLGVHPSYLNLRYAYEQQTVLKWLTESSEDIVVGDNISVPGRLPMPYLFARVADNSKGVAKRLWEKTVWIHGQKTEPKEQD